MTALTIPTDLHELLNKMRIISSIQEGQKIDSIGKMNIYTPSVSSWILRKWHGNNKDETIRTLTELYKTFSTTINTLILEHSAHGICEEKYEANFQYILKMSAAELRKSIDGLDNLSKTYNTYPHVYTALEGLLRDYIIQTYDQLIVNLPVESLTKELRDPIKYRGAVVYEKTIETTSKAIRRLPLSIRQHPDASV